MYTPLEKKQDLIFHVWNTEVINSGQYTCPGNCGRQIWSQNVTLLVVHFQALLTSSLTHFLSRKWFVFHSYIIMIKCSRFVYTIISVL